MTNQQKHFEELQQADAMRATLKRMQGELRQALDGRVAEQARAEDLEEQVRTLTLRLTDQVTAEDLKAHVLALTPRAFALEAIQIALRFIGEDPARAGLLETPRRWIDAMLEMTSGHSVDIEKLLKVTFDSGNYDEIIAVTNIAFTSLCEHHLIPFTGTAAVAYLPSNATGAQNSGYRVVGLSKIPRLVDAFARRLQMQEQMTIQIAEALLEHLQPRGVAVLLRGEHSCASCRGVRKSGMVMITSSMHGVFKEDAATRAEVLQLLERGAQ